MTKTDVKEKGAQKIALSASRDIPFNKLILSQSNVRRVKAGVSIEELATDIARRTLLQSLTVRPVLDEAGVETGMFEVPAGGRRYRALEFLVKQKRLARNAPVPCVVRTEGIAEEDSLAENIQRAPLHPLDQFRAFLTLIEKGQTEEEVAAVFFVSVAVVKQRLRLASVSPKLHDVYAEDDMTLDQLMAFTTSGSRHREQSFIVTSEGAERAEIVARRPLGDRREIMHEDILNNIVRNFSQQPVKESALDMLDRAAAIRRGTIQMVQSSLHSAEARAAAQRRPTTLSERFENRRVNDALQERVSRLIEGLRRRGESIVRVVHASAAMVERLAVLARPRPAKRKTEAEYWRRAQDAGEEFVPFRGQVESQKEARSKGRSR